MLGSAILNLSNIVFISPISASVACIGSCFLASILSLNSVDILADLTKLSNIPWLIVLPLADDCINASPKLNAGLAISPSKPPLSFQLADALSKSTPAMLDSFCIKPISSACLTPLPPVVIGSVAVFTSGD